MRQAERVLSVMLAVGVAACARSAPATDAEAEASSAPRASAATTPAQTSTDYDRWREHLANMVRDGTMWWTANDTYREEDDGIEAYLMRYEAHPGGISGRGCLWGQREGETLGPFWEFFLGWDPAVGKPIVYQSGRHGVVGSGHAEFLDDTRSVLDQTFRNPDGTTFRSRHENEMPDADTEVGASLNWVDGEWEPRRSYTWHRRPVRDAPC